MLGTLLVLGRPTILDNSRARAKVRVGVVWTFFSLVYLFSFLSSSLGDGPI